MKTELIEEMFPSKSVQRLAQKIIDTLEKCPDSDALQISELISFNKSTGAKIAGYKELYHILDGLRALGIVSCTNDLFSLNHLDGQTFRPIYCLDNAKKRKLPLQRSQLRYVVFICSNCGAAIGSRSSQLSTTCKTCNHKNSIDNGQKVLIRTHSFLDLQEAIQQANIQRLQHGKSKFYSKPILSV